MKKFGVLQISQQEGSSEDYAKRADAGLIDGSLKDIEFLFVSGIGLSEPMIPSEDQADKIRNRKRWAQVKANGYGIPVIAQTLAATESDDENWYMCSFKFEPGKSRGNVLSTNAYFADMKNWVVVFPAHLCLKLAEYVLRRKINFILLHMDSEFQEDTKTAEPELESLRQLLDPLERLVTTNYRITVLILSCGGTGDDSVRTGGSALLHIEQGKVYVHKIWGHCETKLGVFETTTTPNQTLIYRQNRLRLTEPPKLYDEQAFADELLLSLNLSDSPSWLFSLDFLDKSKTTILVFSMKRDSRTEVNKWNRDLWISKFNHLFIPRPEDELLMVFFTERNDIQGLHQLIGSQEPSLNGLYANRKEYMASLSLPKLDFYKSGSGYDAYIATITPLERAGHCITCNCRAPAAFTSTIKDEGEILRHAGTNERGRQGSRSQ